MLAGSVTAFVSALLPGCQFPNYSLPVGNAGAPQGGGGGGSGGGVEPGGRAGPAAGGGGGDAGAAADGGEGGAAGSEPCPPDACSAKAPSGWRGPIAFWEQPAGSDAPECPPGYTDPKDVHRGLVAPNPTCECTCKPEGQSCETNTTLDVFYDMSCGSTPPCASVSLSKCTPISSDCGSQGSFRADIPMPAGGSCVPHFDDPVPPAWEFDARICLPSEVQVCDGDDQVCAPAAPAPYEPASCVTRDVPAGEAVPACPAGFTKAHPKLYAAVSDGRGCSDCKCSTLSGGSCAGTLTISMNGDCVGATTYTLGEGCKPYNLGSGPVSPESVRGEYKLTPGACSVTTPSAPQGKAVEGGAVTLVCCRP